MSVSNADQAEFWTRFGDVWVAQQSDLDGLLAPVLDLVMEAARLKAEMDVLDIGCGTGTSTISAAAAIAPLGRAVGVDISPTMLDRARMSARNVANVSFQLADAAEFDFVARQYDHIISRFGVMFFNDPVTAFANILTGLKPGAGITMAAWSNLEANPWFLEPMRAAKARLGAPPRLDPDAPGPLAFRSIERVIGIMKQAGFVDIQGTAHTVALTPPGDIQHVAEHACSIGPASRTMEHFNGTQQDFAALADAVATAFAPYQTDDGVCVPAEINLFTARAPSV